jgi:hypothetical protein
MRIPSSVSGISRVIFVLLLAAGSAALIGGSKSPSAERYKVPRADQDSLDFVVSGLTITINSAAISSAGVITVTYTLTDPNGLLLDATGATTPGVISLSFIAAYIPKGQEQYVARSLAP